MLPIFVSLDGIDGTGKSTQCRLLAEWMRSCGLSVTECADPGGTPIGDVLRSLLLDHRREMTLPCEAFLFMASRAELVARVLLPALDAGGAAVADRFLLANVAYQGYGGGLDVDELWRMGRLATGSLEPDLTIVLDLPLDVAFARRGRTADRMERRAREYHERVRAGFLAEAKRRPETVYVLDAMPSVEEVHRQICRLVVERFGA
jgi:dTMP kinase